MLKGPQNQMNKHFSRIALVGKVEDARVADSLAALATHLRGRGVTVYIDREVVIDGLPDGLVRKSVAELGADADLIVAIGGDGTLLFAAQLALGRGVPLLGVNRGRLGFLTDVLPDEMIGNLDAVIEGRYETDRARNCSRRGSRSRTDARCDYRALNDVVVQRQETGRMVELEVWIDGRFVNTHGGDGLVIASFDRVHRLCPLLRRPDHPSVPRRRRHRADLAAHLVGPPDRPHAREPHRDPPRRALGRARAGHLRRLPARRPRGRLAPFDRARGRGHHAAAPAGPRLLPPAALEAALGPQRPLRRRGILRCSRTCRSATSR